MNKLKLNDYKVEELSSSELHEINGGFSWSIFGDLWGGLQIKFNAWLDEVIEKILGTIC
ncbi:hypothetical protein GMMP15_650017 [Candidatus Magnetomoraceae bacterium gMMP-15]